jgi:predicted permease
MSSQLNFFITIILKLLPLYINILLGYFAGRYLQAQRETVSKILFYIIQPLVIFTSVLKTNLSPSVLSLPFLTFILCSTIAIVFYNISKRIWSDTTVNIMAFTAGSGNTGYYGLTLAILFLSEQGEGIYILGMFGFILFETTTGFYLCAKGTHSREEVFRRLLRLPQLYAFSLGLLLNSWNIRIPLVFNDYVANIKGAFAILGMMIIGLSIANMKGFKLDKQFIGMTFLSKFVVWPLVVMLLILFDYFVLGFYSPEEHQALILLSIIPLAVNTVVIATLLDVQPSKAASAVLLSTLFALFYTPVMCFFFMRNIS